MDTEVGADMRKKGVIGNLDGATVIKIPAARLPENFEDPQILRPEESFILQTLFILSVLCA